MHRGRFALLSTIYVRSSRQSPTLRNLRPVPTAFIVVLFVLGFAMSLGKAAVYKHIPVYYPRGVGAVGGVVGMIGGLGGFVLPIAFGWLKDTTGLWQSCFMLLFAVIAVSAIWMHLSIRRMHRERALAPRAVPAE